MRNNYVHDCVKSFQKDSYISAYIQPHHTTNSYLQ